jgi:hypothetical protein
LAAVSDTRTAAKTSPAGAKSVAIEFGPVFIGFPVCDSFSDVLYIHVQGLSLSVNPAGMNIHRGDILWLFAPRIGGNARSTVQSIGPWKLDIFKLQMNAETGMTVPCRIECSAFEVLNFETNLFDTIVEPLVIEVSLKVVPPEIKVKLALVESLKMNLSGNATLALLGFTQGFWHSLNKDILHGALMLCSEL